MTRLRHNPHAPARSDPSLPRQAPGGGQAAVADGNDDTTALVRRT
jgi:hypothetical protein